MSTDFDQTFSSRAPATAFTGDVRMLTAVRVIVVTSLLVASLIIEVTAEAILPINYLYLTTAFTYFLTIGYIFLARFTTSRDFNLYVQTFGDLFIETILVYFTGGLDSPFTFLYLVSIITAATLLYRRGGLMAASGAVILYGGLADLMYYGLLPPPPRSALSPTEWSSIRLYLNMGANFAGFYAAALLTSYLSEQLRRTFHELDINRRSLARLQALNQNVIESVPSGLVTTTPDGTVTFINPAAREILGIDRTWIGRPISDTGLVSASEWERICASMPWGEVRAEKDDFVRNGEPRFIGYTVTPLKTLDGSDYGFTLIFQDLTDRKIMEGQLRMKDRMAAVGELSAGIAHEIRNPLAAIAGSVQVLRNSKNLSAQEQRLMAIVLKESERLNKSISDFLRFVRPHEREPLTFDIAASLAETVALLENSPELTAQHAIECRLEPPSFSFYGDPDQMRQVFWNVARNAIQAMPAGGILRITTTLTGGDYRIAFSDSGSGMEPRQLSAMFQPFRTGFPSGTGLGMAISYRIVQEHGGRIEADSEPGIGTTITIVLPIHHPQEVRDETPVDSTTAG
jgi:two-component system, NtrC family, sensor histidine kinase PilS